VGFGWHVIIAAAVTTGWTANCVVLRVSHLTTTLAERMTTTNHPKVQILPICRGQIRVI
jgi:hypothetical protein